jgi:predicted nuclease with TOPRIM domain
VLPAPTGWEDVLKSMQDMLGRLLETFAAANEGLLAENRRLHEQLLTQAETLGKGQAERERLQSQLTVVPSEIQLLTERLSAMQEEMQRLHSVNAQVVEEAVRAATQELRRRPWWMRLFNR